MNTECGILECFCKDDDVPAFRVEPANTMFGYCKETFAPTYDECAHCGSCKYLAGIVVHLTDDDVERGYYQVCTYNRRARLLD